MRIPLYFWIEFSPTTSYYSYTHVYFLLLVYANPILLLVGNETELINVKNLFESNSVLQFTYEMEKQNQLAFLDRIVKQCSSKIQTAVYVKDTNLGNCINYKGICSEKYKISVIATLLHRGCHISHDWNTFHEKILRMKQLLANNNFPMKVIYAAVNSFLSKKFSPFTHELNNNDINV